MALSIFFVGCEIEDYTGDSVLNPGSASLSITTTASSTSLIEDDSVYEFTATLSQPMPVDIKLFAMQVDGDATEGSDFEMDGDFTIPAGSTTATGTIKILIDDLVEETETVKIQIGDNRTANTDVDPTFMEFTILNYEDGDLVIDMDWSIPYTTDNSGEEISAEAFADLRLLLTDVPYSNELDSADGAGFETYVLSGAAPDGEYYIVADIFAASDIVRNISLNSNFNQGGIINDMGFSFENALNNTSYCSDYYYILNKITKSGTDYTIEEVGELSEFASTSWSGEDAYFNSHVVTSFNCDGLTISGLNKELIEGWWGEPIVEEGTVYYTVDGSGVVTIADQYIFTTTYDGSLYDYNVSGTGTLDEVTGELDLVYDIFNTTDGYSVNQWGYDNGYFPVPLFYAFLTSN